MEKTNSISLCTLIVGLSGAPIWGTISSYLYKTSKNSIMISLIIGFIISLFIVKYFLSLFNKETNLSFSNKMKKIYGKFSIVINTIFIMISITLYIFLTYRLTAFLSSQYLIETPKIFLLILILTTTFYIASKGLETIVRVSVISLFLAFFIFSFDIFSLVKYVELDNYLPIFNSSITSIIKSSLSFAIYFSVPTIFITTIKKDSIVDKEKFNKYFYIMYTFSFLIIFFAITTTLGIFGINLTTLFDYPLYTVLKRITLFSFIDAVENISIMLWLLYVINASNMMLKTAFDSIKDTFNIKKNKVIYIIVFIITSVVPLLFFMNNNYVETFNYIKIPLIICTIIIPIVLLSLIIYKKKM